jgi:lipoate-protein ligase A
VNGFIEPHPGVVEPNPGGADDPLCESVLDPACPWLRVHQPRDVRLVIGRHQDPARELLLDAARAERVPVHRRVSGGGAVVLAPGMLIIALRLRNTLLGTACWFELVNRVLAPAVAQLAGVLPSVRGHGDLACVGADGITRKILGASLRQTSRAVYYLGVLLIADRRELMARYLQLPSRAPDYRLGRGHADFCTQLEDFGVSLPAAQGALTAACQQGLAGHAAH